jgi:hypothetical protein
MTTTAVATSPFDCRWIVRGSERHLGAWNYALCVRVRDNERLVNECDCSRCVRWEPSEHPGEPAGEPPDHR